jgi:hypothetical protein
MNMIKKILWFACCMGAGQAFSQNCQDFLFMQKNKTIEMTIYNKKGEPNGKQVYQITDVTNAGAGVTASIASEMFDQKGKSMAKANTSIQCNGGSILVDMRMMLPQQQQQQTSNVSAKVQAFYLEYPAALHVGDALKDGNLSMDISSGGPGGPPGMPGPPKTLTMLITNRKVEAQENVTTSAGTWNCFKISFKSKITVKAGPFGFPVNVECTEWFAPGFGVVKTQTKNGGTAITSIK